MILSITSLIAYAVTLLFVYLMFVRVSAFKIGPRPVIKMNGHCPKVVILRNGIETETLKSLMHNNSDY